ncbi:MAG: hypothetical protein IT386_06600 [Deltaproteobacteria bacterium]|nr:hypothetical protein [Deltaproteobacteria bacterium]
MAAPEDEKPIVSLLADDPDERSRIEVFVVGLGESVDSLQDLEQAADFARLADLAHDLGRGAASHGFPSLSQAATHSATAATARDGKQTREALLALTEIARRIRLGHRGAV